MKRTMTLMISLLAILFTVSCGAGQKPQDMLATMVKDAKAKDYNGVWNHLSAASQQDFDKKIFSPIKEKLNTLPDVAKKQVNNRLGISAEALLKMTAKDYFILVMDKTDAAERLCQQFDPSKMEIEQETIEGTHAMLKIKGSNSPINFIKEGGRWKMEWQI